MDVVTWRDLIEIAILVIAIITCFRNKKDNRPALTGRAVIF